MAGDNNSSPSSKSENYIENQVKNIYDSKLRLQGQRATDVLLEFANLRPGLHVLDLASGSGVPAIDIARIVGSSGHVTATDQSANALDLAKTEAESEG